MAQLVSSKVENGTAIVTLSISDNNAFHNEAFGVLDSALAELSAQPGVRSLVLNSAAKGFFSNGLDPHAIHGRPEGELATLIGYFFSVLRRLYLFPAPTVAAIDGHAIGYGAMLGAMCDFRILTEKGARISYPELNIGVTLPVFVCRRLIDLVGERAARDFLFTSLAPKPPEALSLGLVDELVPEENVKARAQSLADRLAKLPQQATRAQKAILRRCTMSDLDTIIAADQKETLQLLGSAEAREGFAAMVEKRRPKFN
ncbi:MAG: enoyl-CoA hydratase/isomerase family protein [Leptospirales bacterium]|nr:enoyl-CoA hydratase/isomerase family protein [Leptospirales bacterium]